MNQLEIALIAAAEHGGAPARVWDIGPDTEIELSDETGHLLAGATITEWSAADVAAGRSE